MAQMNNRQSPLLGESVNEIAKQAAYLSKEELEELLTQKPTDKQTLIQGLFYGLDERRQLETLGRYLSPDDLIFLLTLCLPPDTTHLWKFSPIFVPVNHKTFKDLLLKAPAEPFAALQHEALVESMQHHLTVLAHDMSRRCDALFRRVEALREEITHAQPQYLSSQDLIEFLCRLEAANEDCMRDIELINRSLAIGWNTNRPDIVDSINKQKESYQRLDREIIGHPETLNAPPTGMYRLYASHLSKIYGNNEDPDDIEALRDEEPAIEALAKLSIWYLKDYWELGLLPSIQSESQLRLDPFKHTDKKCAEHREKLLQEMKNSLSQCDLKSVKDFKRHHIYSKKMLLDHINRCRQT